MGMTNLPLTPAAFQALLAPYALGPRVAVAVSGGPDSTALAWGAKAAGYDVTGLLVEHGLRPESPQEARDVQASFQRMGIPVHILTWQHEAVASRVHVRARDARYDLLVSACKAQGLDTLLLAHHRGDQAETILMRFAKGSGLSGLSGMAAESERNGVRLIRPLLGIDKQSLIATCQAYGLSTVTDPSNLSDHYARGRLRRVQDLLESEGFTAERLLDLGSRAGEAAEAIAFYAKAFLKDHATLQAGGAVSVALDGWSDLPRAVALQALSLILMSVNRADYPPQREPLLRALAFVLSGQTSAYSFYGCLFQRGQGRVTVLREPSCVRDVHPAGGTFIWDARWRIRGGDDGEIRALGSLDHAAVDALCPALRKAIPSGRVRAGLPSLWKNGQLVALPDFSGQAQTGFGADFLPPVWL